MTRSGMAAILRAVLYSGCFLNNRELSRVDVSSDEDARSARKQSREEEICAFVCLLEFGF